MTGHKPSIFFKLCWKFFIPAFSGVIEMNLDRLGVFLPETLLSSVPQVCFLLYLVYYKPLQLDRYVYPGWVPGLGWFMLLSPVILVPLWIIGHVSLTPGPFRQVGSNLLDCFCSTPGVSVKWLTKLPKLLFSVCPLFVGPLTIQPGRREEQKLILEELN